MPEREYYVWEEKGKEKELWEKFYSFTKVYAKSFHTLIDHQQLDAKLGRNYDDDEIFPILMVFCHFLELSFKSILLKKGISIEEVTKLGHSPLAGYKKVIETCSDFSLDKQDILFIEDLDEMNKSGESMRYPSDKGGKRFWVHDKEGRCFLLTGIWRVATSIMIEIQNYIEPKR